MKPRTARRYPRAAFKALIKLWAEDRGVVALEYAFAFPLFFAMFFGTFQFGMVFATQSLLDNATRNAARLMRIGTLTSTPSTYTSALVASVCNDLTLSSFTLVPNCSGTIQVYVAAASAGTPSGVGFTALNVASITNGVMTSTKASLLPKYDVLLQIAYKTTWYAALFSGTTVIMSTIAFQTEPY
jgi:Flp pilus assembly protein TadG